MFDSNRLVASTSPEIAAITASRWSIHTATPRFITFSSLTGGRVYGSRRCIVVPTARLPETRLLGTGQERRARPCPLRGTDLAEVVQRFALKPLLVLR